MHRYIYLLLITLMCSGCNQTQQPFDQQKAADTWRYPAPEGVVKDADAIKSLKLELVSNYPIWRNTLAVTIEATVQNTTKSFVHARIMPHLFIYDPVDKSPLYWSNIDIAFAESVGPGTMSIIAIPVNGSHTTSIPVKSVKFADVHVKQWPDYYIYDMVPTGSYLLRLEMDVYNENNERMGTILSNFIEFTTILTPPESIPDK